MRADWDEIDSPVCLPVSRKRAQRDYIYTHKRGFLSRYALDVSLDLTRWFTAVLGDATYRGANREGKRRKEVTRCRCVVFPR